jgi:hypothetical protein
MNSEEKIRAVGQAVVDLLVSKNKAYGDSALRPANIFAKGSSVENLCSRIDDKLMRIKNKGIGVDTEDTVQDLIGYLILLKIALHEESEGRTGNIPLQREGDEANALSERWAGTYTYPVREEQIFS